MDFVSNWVKENKKNYEVVTDFIINLSKVSDIMVRGKGFYAIWDEERGIWSTDEYDAYRLIDKQIHNFVENYKFPNPDKPVIVKYISNFSSGLIIQFHKFLTNLADNAKTLDNKVTFLNDVVKKHDYVSKRLPYSIENGSTRAYDELMSVLYSPEERKKLEWAVGAVLEGVGKNIQKFIVLFGGPGSGKSTFLNIVQLLFNNYYTTFEAKALTSNNNQFAMEMFRNNSLVAIQHDGDLSHIEDNSKLNSIISHEEMTINEKYKSGYTARINCLLFMGTNRPVKISDSNSGVIRRLIDVKPTGELIPISRYNQLMEQIKFELGSIAFHCKQVFSEMGQGYYNSYRAKDMMLRTNIFYNFIEENYLLFKQQDMTTLSQAYELYKEYCKENTSNYVIIARHIFRDELKNYFNKFLSMTTINNKPVRNVYRGFKSELLEIKDYIVESNVVYLQLTNTKSIFDIEYADCQAQYANGENGVPLLKWDDVKTRLKDLNTHVLHYVRPPENHIVIDFDLKDENGDKSLKLNLEAASNWPPTYTEYSKSEKGLHLHYIYDGDASKLANVYSDGIEIKVFTGKSSLRRKLTKCNSEPINHISGGLPIKEDKMISSVNSIQSELGLRRLIERNLHKEIHPATKPSIDFIYKILEEAYESDLKYDVSDMQQAILTFAMHSTNNADYCVGMVSKMKFKSKDATESVDNGELYSSPDEGLVFFDCEVFPNLLLVCYKEMGEGKQCVRLFNPTKEDVEQLFKFRLVGYNCKGYDNHILYGRYLGLNNQKIFEKSQALIDQRANHKYSEAYNISYTDVADFIPGSKFKSLKEWEIDLGIDHIEINYAWDEKLPEKEWNRVADYCCNDVIATEKLFYAHEADWTTRKILADLADGSVNDSTNQLSNKIIFGDERNPELVYTNLATGEQS